MGQLGLHLNGKICFLVLIRMSKVKQSMNVVFGPKNRTGYCTLLQCDESTRKCTIQGVHNSVIKIGNMSIIHSNQTDTNKARVEGGSKGTFTDNHVPQNVLYYNLEHVKIEFYLKNLDLGILSPILNFYSCWCNIVCFP